MAVTFEDLLQPTGELAASSFPGEAADPLADRLSTYLEQGYANAATAGVTEQATLDAAAKAWAYYRAYSAIHQRLAANPVAATFVDQGSYTMPTNTASQFARLASAKLEEYHGLISVPQVIEQQGSVSIHTIAVW